MAQEEPNTFAVVTKEVALLFRPIAEGMAEPFDTEKLPPFFALLLEQAGIVLDAAMGAGKIAAIRTHLESVKAAYEVIAQIVEAEKIPDLGQVPAIAQSLTNAFNALKALSELELEAVGPDGALVALEEMGRLLLEYLLAEYFSAGHPKIYNALLLIGVIDNGKQDAPTLGGRMVRVRLPMLVNLLRDPQATFAMLTQWGGEDFNPYRILVPLAYLLHSLGFPAELSLPTSQDAKALGWNEESSEGSDVELRIPLVREDSTVEAEVGFSLLPLRNEEGNPRGLALVPYGVGETAQRIDLGGNWDFSYRFEGNVTVRYGLVIDFDETSVRAMDEGESLPADIRLKTLAAVRRTSEKGKRYQIFALPGLGLLEMGGAGLHVGFEFEDGKAAFYVEVPMRDARLVIKADKADSFLQKVLPAEGFEQTFDVTVGWSSKKGMYLREGADKQDVEQGRGLEGKSASRSAAPQRLARTRSAEGGAAKGKGFNTTVSVKADLMGIVQVDSVDLGVTLGDNGVVATAASTVAIKMGPVTAVVEKMGIEATLTFPNEGGNLGLANLDLDFKPPSGAALKIEAAAVKGGGYLFFDHEKEQYAGILELEVADKIALKAIGLITTRMPDGSRGFSLFILITAEGFAPLQLGLGFTLNGVGGLLGVNRTVMTNVLRQGLRQGTLDSILFPKDPLRNAPTVISNLNAVFPAAEGRYLFGPMAVLGWGTPTLLKMKLALILEIPDPVRLILLGRMSLILPSPKSPIVQIQLDMLGELNFQEGTLSLDGVLFESRIRDFPLTGAMALRVGWGDKPHFLLSIGGFNPRFPAPTGLPALERMALSISNSENLRLRMEGYLAVTSNTVQFGSRAELFVKVGALSVDGYLGFDTLIQFSPFGFIADIAAGVALRYNGKLLAGIQIKVELSGPTPWHVRGSASIKILFISYSVDIDHRFGAPTPPPLPEPVAVAPLLRDAVVNLDNWSATLPTGAKPLVTLRDVAGGGLVAHPMARLAMRQKVVPLNETIERFGNARPTDGSTFAVNVAMDSGELTLTATTVDEYFAMGQYHNWSEEQKLQMPSFQHKPSGYEFGSDSYLYEEAVGVEATIGYEIITITPDAVTA